MITLKVQYCEKVVQAKCANFVLCFPDFSRKTSQEQVVIFP